MNQLKYFEGKVCSVLTEPTNRNFKEEVQALNKPQLYPQNVLDHFIGRVVHTDPHCIILEHILLKTRSYFRVEKIIGIIEEQEFNPNNPKDAEIIEKYKNSQTSLASKGKVKCPNGHELLIPMEAEEGKQVECPVCNASFVLIVGKHELDEVPQKTLPRFNGAADINLLKKLSEEAKK